MLLFGAAAAKLHVGMAKHWMKSLVVGMSRRWRTALTQALGIIGTVWLITEILTRVSSEANAWVTSHGDAYLGIVLAAGSILKNSRFGFTRWGAKAMWSAFSTSSGFPTRQANCSSKGTGTPVV